MATTIRRARKRRLDTLAAASAVAALFIVVERLGFIATTQPLAMLPLCVALTVLAFSPWGDTRGFVIATSAGIAALAIGCSALAVAL